MVESHQSINLPTCLKTLGLSDIPNAKSFITKPRSDPLEEQYLLKLVNSFRDCDGIVRPKDLCYRIQDNVRYQRMIDYYAQKQEEDGEDFDCLVQMMIVDEKYFRFHRKYRRATKYFELSLPASNLLIIIIIDLDDYDDKP